MKPVTETYMGTSAASITATHRMGVSLHNSDGVQYGTDTGDLFDIDIDNTILENTSEKEGLFTGLVEVSVDGGFDLDNNIRIVSESPLPCIVRGLIPQVTLTGL